MTQISQPSLTANIIAAATSVAPADQKVLFVGQQGSAATQTTGALKTNIQNDNSWDTLYGARSHLAGMLRNARKLNQDVRFDAIGLDDAGGGVAATGTFTFVGTATAVATLTFIVGSKKNHSYDVVVAVGATETSIATLLNTAIGADTKVPVTAGAAAGVVTVTANNAGLVGNSIGLKMEGSVAGITLVIVAMASGATDPTLTSVFDVIGTQRYQTIVWAFSSALTELKTLLDARFNATNLVQDGIGIVGIHDTYANLLVTLNAENSQSLAIVSDKTTAVATYRGPAQLELGYSKASQFAAIRSLRLQADTDISQFVISRNGALDSIGGPGIASKPYFNTLFPDLPQIDTGLGFTDVEVEGLLAAGGFVLGNNLAGNAAIAGEVVTTYKTDSAGNADVSFSFMNYVDTISTIREYYFSNLKKRFAQSRLTEGALVRGRDMANQALVEAYCTQLHTELSQEGFVLTQAGEAALQFYIRNLVVTLDLSTGKATVSMKSPIVTQLRTIIATIQIAFSTTG